MKREKPLANLPRTKVLLTLIASRNLRKPMVVLAPQRMIIPLNVQLLRVRPPIEW